MKIPRDLSGADLISILSRNFGYRRLHQVGSRVILETDSPRRHRIAIPDHNPLRIGTLTPFCEQLPQRKELTRRTLRGCSS